MSRFHRRSARGTRGVLHSLLLLAVALAAAPAAAITEAIAFEELCLRSRAIVVGTVQSQSFHASDGVIYTTTTVAVENSIRGRPGATVEVRTMGGVFEGVALHAPMEPKFAIGERVVLFLEGRDAKRRPVAHSQGKFRVVGDEVLRGRRSHGSLDSFVDAIHGAPLAPPRPRTEVIPMRMRRPTALVLATSTLFIAMEAGAWLTYENFPPTAHGSGRFAPPAGDKGTIAYKYDSAGAPGAFAGAVGRDIVFKADNTWDGDRGSAIDFQGSEGACDCELKNNGTNCVEFSASGVSSTAGTAVVAGDPGGNLDPFVADERHADPIANGTFDSGEGIYWDDDSSGTVTVDDVRLAVVGAMQGSLVAAGDGDIGTALVAFAANERHVQFIGGTPNYDSGEDIYTDNAPTGVISVGDVRLTNTSRTLAATTVRSAVIGEFDEFDICIDPEFFSDLQSVILHEFGHAFGLDHPDASIDLPQVALNGQRPPEDYEKVVMFHTIGLTDIKRTPMCDDKAGANFLYPPEGVTPGVDFEPRSYFQGNSGGCDFGDAPDPLVWLGGYRSLEVWNGARHKDSRMEWLGWIGEGAGVVTLPEPIAGQPATFEPANAVLFPPDNGFNHPPFPGSVIAGQTGDAYTAGSVVAGGDGDVGTSLIAFNGNERHIEFDVANGTYEHLEFIYRDVDASGTVTIGDLKLWVLGSQPGSAVAAGDPAIGFAIIAFAAAEKHANPGGGGNNYDAGEGIYDDADASDTVNAGDTRLNVVSGPAVPASATFETDAPVASADELDDGVSLRGPLEPGVPVTIDILVNTSGLAPNRYYHFVADRRLYVNGWEDWNADGDWKDWSPPIAGGLEYIGPGGTAPCVIPEASDEYVLHWQGSPIADEYASPNFCGGTALAPDARYLTFVITPPEGAFTNSTHGRIRLDYGENVGQNLRDFSDLSLIKSASEAVTPDDRAWPRGFELGEAKYGEVEDYAPVAYLPHELSLDFTLLPVPDVAGASVSVTTNPFAHGVLTDPKFPHTPASGTLTALRIDANLDTGTLGPHVGGGALIQNELPVPGILRLCLLGIGCDLIPPVPLAVWTTNGAVSAAVGVGGRITRSLPGPIRVSIVGAPWTIGSTAVTNVMTSNSNFGTLWATGFTHAAGSGTLTSGAAGLVQLVSPIKVITDLPGVVVEIATLTVRFLPEPGAPLLLVCGAACMAVLGRKRMKR